MTDERLTEDISTAEDDAPDEDPGPSSTASCPPDRGSTPGDGAGGSLSHGNTSRTTSDGSVDIFSATSAADLLDLVRALNDRVSELVDVASAFHQRSEAYEAIIRRMQDETEALRGDQVRALLKPVVVSLADLHAEAVRAQGFDFAGMTPERIVREFEFFAGHVVGTIEGLGFESVGAEPGAEFDSSLHAAGKALPTADRALDRRIAIVRRQGFHSSENARPLVYARVDVYRLDPAAGGNASAPADAGAVTDGGSGLSSPPPAGDESDGRTATKENM